MVLSQIDGLTEATSGSLQTEAPALDQYSDPSWKLAFLLQLPEHSTLIVDGERGDSLRHGLSRLGFRAISPMQASEADARTARALVALPGSAVPADIIERLAACLAPGSQVLGFFPHRWSPLSGARSCVRNLVSTRTRRMAPSVRRIERAGFTRPDLWLPLPKHTFAEEYVRLAEIDEVAASLAVAAPTARRRARLHDGFGIYGCAPSGGMHLLARRLEQALAETGRASSLRVTRFDLRERGALVLFLADASSGESFVCRVVHGATAEHLDRHWQLQASVRASLQAPALRSLIPEGIAAVRLDDYRCWLEMRLPGSISWRLPRAQRGRLDGEMVAFLASLTEQTGIHREVGESDILRELEVWRAQVGERLSGELADLMSHTARQLQAGLQGRHATFGWVHGDFGYGNVLAAPEQGSVLSVIDWETAAPEGFAGVDLFNFLLQRARTDHGSRLCVAVAELLELVAAGKAGAQIEGARDYLDRFVPGTWLQLMTVGVTLYRWIRREHRYTLSRPIDTADFKRSLQFLLQRIAGQAA